MSNLPIGAQIFLALNLDKAPLLRRIAASLVAVYVMELHRYGHNPGYDSMIRLCRRFQLFDWKMALQVHFPQKS